MSSPERPALMDEDREEELARPRFGYEWPRGWTNPYPRRGRGLIATCRATTNRLARTLDKKTGLMARIERAGERDVRIMRRVHCYRFRASGWTLARIAELMGCSPQRVSQIIAQEHRRRLRRWRLGLPVPYIRGDSPIHTEPWLD